MKIKFISALALLLTAPEATPKPGEPYTLTGKEKSIEAIVKADMQMYPDLYNGETLKFYVVKFKNENRIGKRKLTPGDQLSFPETKASIKSKKAAELQLLIGKWSNKIKLFPESDVFECYIVDYHKDGTFSGTMTNSCISDLKVEYSGVWEIVDTDLRQRITKTSHPDIFSPKKLSTQEIITITDTKLTTRVHGSKKLIKSIRAE